MVVIQINDQSTLQEHLGKGKLVVVDFKTTWCPPCNMIAPKVEAFSNDYTDVIFLKVDGDESPDLTTEYKISAFPTFLFFKDGKLVETIVGAIPDKLKENIEKYK
ncbi:hypothetical protein RclHR1_05790015 [Rhizophagus clarus]|uniref:Thioredoxin n=1 Tax=Rhizophagus clarus TaxID=94130 RepID=A0A2Z6RPW8_9GLOM|nr:hypothetical protein RclHR1_05790015 [Rhizophagus clarus]GES79508.1 thioredoxin-2 [Rhizophagus clarus]